MTVVFHFKILPVKKSSSALPAHMARGNKPFSLVSKSLGAFFLECLSQQHWGSMTLMSHHTVTTTAAEQGQQLQARAVVQGILYPGCWPWACPPLGFVTAKTPNAAPPHHPAQCPVPIPGGTLCHLGSECPFSGLTEIKPRARTPKVGLLSPGPALAVLPPAQEPLHAAAAASTLLRAVWGGRGWARQRSPRGIGGRGNSGEPGLDAAWLHQRLPFLRG